MKSNPAPLLLKNALIAVFLFLFVSMGLMAQNLYTARGYWQEATKQSYLTIKEKKEKGQAISADEEAYVQDYESYLLTYYNRLSEDEKQLYQRKKVEWDRELVLPTDATQANTTQQPQVQTEFEWRGRDRAINAMYGIYYGASLSAIVDIQDEAAVGVSLVTGGVWMLGPVINPKKYEGITETTMRAANTGKLLGLAYGASLGLAIAGESDDVGKVALGLSTVGSIAMGEIAFQVQKKKNVTAGKIEIMRHYGFIGPLAGASVLATTNTENANLIGLGLLVGGAGGLMVGNKVANKYDYTRGDVDALSSLGVISTGLGIAVIANALENNSDVPGAIWLVPASFAVGGTLIGQRQVRNAHLTNKQGSTINLSTFGAGLVGVGVMALTDSESVTAWVAVPSVLALITHQAVFNNYKKNNLLGSLRGHHSRKRNYDFSMKLMPENYFVNKNTPARFIADPRLASTTPLVNMSFKFK